MEIDLNKLVPGCKYFRWKEVLFLPQWGIHCFPTDIQYLNLIRITQKLDTIRKYLNQPIHVTSGLRPSKYNELIGGARHSAHKLGQALDFQVRKIKCDRVRELLEPNLDDWNIRMEKKPGSNWIHIDSREPGQSGRYFIP